MKEKKVEVKYNAESINGVLGGQFTQEDTKHTPYTGKTYEIIEKFNELIIQISKEGNRKIEGHLEFILE